MDKTSIDIVWISLCSFLVFVMQAGFLCLETGLTRTKNNINIAIKNITDLGISICLFALVGYSVMFGDSVHGFFGSSAFFLTDSGQSPWANVSFLYQALFCGTAVTILSGAVAERIKFGAYIFCAVIISSIIYPMFGHWVWGGIMQGTRTGWLAIEGFNDFAGSTVVHSVGGWVALAALIVIGPRYGRFREDNSSVSIRGSNLPIAILGVFLLWFGWFGFNGGGALSYNEDVPRILTNTAIAGSFGLVAALILSSLMLKHVSVRAVMNGALAGLVSVTASCNAVTMFSAAIIGALGGMVMILSDRLLERFKIDDAVGAIPVHLAAGIWGTLSFAIFAQMQYLAPGLSRLEQFFVQLEGIVVCFAWTFGSTYLLLKTVNKVCPLRVSLEDEEIGLNIAEHNEGNEHYDFIRVIEHHGKTGDLTQKVSVDPFTEIGRIAAHYNQLMNKLDSTLVKNEELEKATTELGLAAIKIQQRTKELELSNLELEQFAAIAAHDLRAPLRRIRTFGEMLLEGGKGRFDVEDYQCLERMRTAALRLEEVVGGVLDLARIKREDAEFEEVDLGEVARDVVASLNFTISDINGTVEILNELPIIQGNPVQIHRLMQNLIDNGLKYRRDDCDPVVKISNVCKNNIPEKQGSKDIRSMCELHFSDNGIGIPNNKLNSIFDLLQRVHTSEKYSGLGIGLAVCRKIIDIHEGEIVVNSEVNQGTTFVVKLPISQDWHR